MYKIRFIIFFIFIFLVGCSTPSSVKRGGLAPEVSSKFNPYGHLSPEAGIPKSLQKYGEIPSISNSASIFVPHEGKLKAYSVSAIDVPIRDVLFKLATSAGKNLILNQSVKGKITVNLIHQPLDLILKTLTNQVGAVYKISSSSISVKPDKPYWKTYHINYVNMKKNSTGSIALNMSIGNGVSDSSSSSTGSVSQMTTSTDEDFWSSIQQNLLSLSYAPNLKVSGGGAPSTTASSTPTSTKASTTASSTPTSTKASNTNGTAVASSSTNSTGSSYSRVVINKEAGLISVFTLAKNQSMIANYLNKALTRVNRQVLIEATVVEVQLSDHYQAGVDWQALAGGNTSVSQKTIGAGQTGQFNIAVGTPSFTNFNLTALQKYGDTKVLSSPRIMAVSNQTALLKVVNNEVYFTVKVDVSTGTGGSGNTVTYDTQVHTIPVGFMMSMTPFITDSGEISINVRPTLSRIVSYVNDPNPQLKQQNVTSQIPVIQEREMSSVLRLRNKQTAIIGGLIQDSHDNSRSGVPGLSNLPGVGDLFAYRDDAVKKNELLIFIRPVIIKNPDINFGDLQDYKHLLKTRTTNTE